MGERIFGIDVSSHQGLFDYSKAKSKGVRWVVFKGTDVGSVTGVGFTDVQANNNYNNAKMQGLLVGSYCWMDATKDGKYQADYYLKNIYNKYKLDFPPILDFEELDGLKNPQKYVDDTRQWLDIVEKATGRIPVIYTAKWYTDRYYQKLLFWMNRYPLWVAMYRSEAELELPSPWSTFKIWQYASNASYPVYNGAGGNSLDWGSSNDDGLDMNWYNGSYNNLLEFCNLTSEPTPEPILEPTEPLYKAEVTSIGGLFVRSSPQVLSDNKIDFLAYRTTVDVYQESNEWRKISSTKDRWASGTWLKRIDDVVIPELKPLGKFKITSKEYINVRGGAGTEHPIIRTIPEGEIVEVYVITSKWLRVSAIKDEWISRELTIPYDTGMPEEIGELDYLYFPFNEMNGYPLSQYFGVNLSWYPNAKGHNGIDWAISPRNELFASRSGTVIRADYNADGYGRSVWIQHFTEDGKKAGRTIYGHLKEFKVKVGDIVKARQLVGLSNGELSDPYRGFSTGAHLHFEYRWDKQAPLVNGGYKYWAVNPLPLLRSWDLIEGKPLSQIYKAVVEAHGLYIRTGAGTQYRAYSGEFYTRGTNINVYQELNGWARVSPTSNRWVSNTWITKK